MKTHGQLTSLGMRLSKLLRDVGEEHAEVTHGTDPQTGEPRIITNNEALVRTIWKLALGYTETVQVKGKDGKLRAISKIHKPDMTCVQIIYDRIEGKVATNADSGKKAQPLSKKIGDRAKQEINALAGDDDGDVQNL